MRGIGRAGLRRERAALGTVLGALLVGVVGCGVDAEEPTAFCEIDGPGVPLPEQITEASGVAWSERHPGLIWVINDGNDGRIFAVDTTGALHAEIPLDIPSVWDIEDLAQGPCEAGSCLYVADVGDNYRIRDTVYVYRMAEPDLDATAVPLDVFPMMHTGGRRVDIESLLLGPNQTLQLLTKGNSEPPSLLRYDGRLDTPGEARDLEEVVRLEGSGRPLQSQFTGASRVPGMPDRWLVRTYQSLALWEVAGGRMVQVPESEIALGPLREPQGEALAVRSDGRVVLASEAGPFGTRGGLNFIRCEGLAER